MSALDVLHFTIYYNDKLYTITASPYLLPSKNGMPLSFDAVVDGKQIGDLNYNNNKWENENINDNELLERIGSFIYSQYNQPKTGTG
jgi:hypothetical protein